MVSRSDGARPLTLARHSGERERCGASRRVPIVHAARFTPVTKMTQLTSAAASGMKRQTSEALVHEDAYSRPSHHGRADTGDDRDREHLTEVAGVRPRTDGSDDAAPVPPCIHGRPPRRHWPAPSPCTELSFSRCRSRLWRRRPAVSVVSAVSRSRWRLLLSLASDRPPRLRRGGGLARLSALM